MAEGNDVFAGAEFARRRPKMCSGDPLVANSTPLGCANICMCRKSTWSTSIPLAMHETTPLLPSSSTRVPCDPCTVPLRVEMRHLHVSEKQLSKGVFFPVQLPTSSVSETSSFHLDGIELELVVRVDGDGRTLRQRT